jgi:hypothetical protein
MTSQTEITTPNYRFSMTVNEGLRMAAGTFILVSVALGAWVNPWWFAFTAFVGANLLQSAFTGTCPMVWILKKLGFRQG